MTPLVCTLKRVFALLTPEIHTYDRSLPNDNKISDNKIRNISKFYCHGLSQEKQRFGTIFHEFSPSPTPSKTQILLILSFRRLWYEMAQMLQKPVFALPGCQRMSVNSLFCDTLGLAETRYLHVFLYMCRGLHNVSGGRNEWPKFMPISFFRRMSFSRTSGAPTRNPSAYWGATPVLSLSGLKLCKFVSRSDLVLISFWMLSIPWFF